MVRRASSRSSSSSETHTVLSSSFSDDEHDEEDHYMNLSQLNRPSSPLIRPRSLSEVVSGRLICFSRPLVLCGLVFAVFSVSRLHTHDQISGGEDLFQVNQLAMDAPVSNGVSLVKSTKAKVVGSEVNLPTEEQTLMDKLSDSSIARRCVADMLIHRYIAETTPDIANVNTMLVSAFEALEMTSTDNEPVQVNQYPYLFVGSVAAALNEDSLREHNITHIINWSSSAKCNLFSGIEYLCITGVRSKSQVKVSHLDKAVEFIETARKGGGKAMSHCWYGRNRSVSLLVAYLMKYADMSAREANDLIKQTRPHAEPYWDQLQQYAEFLSSNTSLRKWNKMTMKTTYQGKGGKIDPNVK